MEEDPETKFPLLVLSACPADSGPADRGPADSRPAEAPRLWGGLKIKVRPGTLAYRVYGREDIEETFNCSYELNPDYQNTLEKAGLRVSGVSLQGNARIVELPDHRFYLGLGFIPQLSSTPEKPHPLLTAFLKAALT